MLERDMPVQPFHDLLSAFTLLTRLPVPQTTRHRPAAAWAWPLVGLVVSGLSAGLALIVASIGAPTTAAAAVYLALSAVITGAIHEDGLADSTDGLFGGWTKERRLEIMKDSHIGSYGTLSLLLSSLFNWALITELLTAGHWISILIAGAVSRVPMALLMSILPNARADGLSRSVGRPPTASLWIGGLIVLIAGALAGIDFAQGIELIAFVAIAAGLVAMLAKQKIGGQTGDILGAAQQVSFSAALLSLAT